MPEANNRQRIRSHQPNRPNFSVIIPAFNEAENIPLLMEKFAETLKENRLFGEIIVVDDGSTDRTWLRARECQGKYRFLRVFTHKVNQGLTAALVTGFRQARSDLFVFYPADLQYLPEELPKLLSRIQEGYDIVCGWRQGKYGFKRFVSFFYNLLSRILFQVSVHDFNSIKAFKREVINAIPLRRDWHRYLVVLAAEKGFKIGEVKVTLHPRRFGKSKFGFWRIPIGVLDLVAVKFQLSFMKKPLLLFGSVGLALIGLAFFIGVVAIVLRFLGEGFRPLLYLVLLFASIGMVSFAMGFLAEIMVVIREKLEEIETRIGAFPRYQSMPHSESPPRRWGQKPRSKLTNPLSGSSSPPVPSQSPVAPMSATPVSPPTPANPLEPSQP